MEDLSNRIEVPFRNIKTLNNLNLIDLISFTQPSPLILKDKIINSSGLCHVWCSWSSAGSTAQEQLPGAWFNLTSLPCSPPKCCVLKSCQPGWAGGGECSETCSWPPGAASAINSRAENTAVTHRGLASTLCPCRGKPGWGDHWRIQLPLSVLLSA